MTNDMERIVAAGYDEIADAYLERFSVSAVRQRWVCRLMDDLPATGGRVLDLGCGAGIPVARDLAAVGHSVVGVDGSTQQIIRARQNVPQAMFIEADMCGVTFEAASFDAICAFYSITHVPPEKQEALIAHISAWLKPGGLFVASFGTGAVGRWTGEWFGTTMFFGHGGEAEVRQFVTDAGLRIRQALVEKQDNEDAEFMWIEATKDC